MRLNTLDVGFQVANSILRTNLRRGGMARMECYVPESMDGDQNNEAVETLAPRGSRIFWLRSGSKRRWSETRPRRENNNTLKSLSAVHSALGIPTFRPSSTKFPSRFWKKLTAFNCEICVFLALRCHYELPGQFHRRSERTSLGVHLDLDLCRYRLCVFKILLPCCSHSKTLVG